MVCKCGSDRLVEVNAKCDDRCFLQYKGEILDSYVPAHLNIGAGDYVNFKYCLSCGLIQGRFPVLEEEVENHFPKPQEFQ